jgi:hypothetical protein
MIPAFIECKQPNETDPPGQRTGLQDQAQSISLCWAIIETINRKHCSGTQKALRKKIFLQISFPSGVLANDLIFYMILLVVS